MKNNPIKVLINKKNDIKIDLNMKTIELPLMPLDIEIGTEFDV